METILNTDNLRVCKKYIKEYTDSMERLQASENLDLFNIKEYIDAKATLNKIEKILKKNEDYVV